jgi:hypothetical protein
MQAQLVLKLLYLHMRYGRNVVVHLVTSGTCKTDKDTILVIHLD